MVLKNSIQLAAVLLLHTIVLVTGCGNQPADNPENEDTREMTRDSGEGNEASESPEWGSEVDLEEMIAMAQKGQIVEIQWHVMPNVLRAQAADGEIYHLRNESKGVDLRNTLKESGVNIGKGGVLFRHVF